MEILNYYGFDYYMLDKELLVRLRCQASVIIGLLMCVVLVPWFYSFYGMAKRQFEARYPEDTVIYVVKNGVFFTSLVVFLVGAFIGYDVLPFFIIKNMPSKASLYPNFYLSIGASVISVYALFVRFSIIYVLSNVRIQLIHPLFSKRFNLKIKPIEYKDIKSVEYDSFWVWNVIYIQLKTSKYFNGLTCFKDLKYVKTLIEENLSKVLLEAKKGSYVSES